MRLAGMHWSTVRGYRCSPCMVLLQSVFRLIVSFVESHRARQMLVGRVPAKVLVLWTRASARRHASRVPRIPSCSRALPSRRPTMKPNARVNGILRHVYHLYLLVVRPPNHAQATGGIQHWDLAAPAGPPLVEPAWDGARGPAPARLPLLRRRRLQRQVPRADVAERAPQALLGDVAAQKEVRPLE